MKGAQNHLTSEKSNSGMEIPDYAIERIARCLLPIMQEYFESEEGQQELRKYEQTVAGETESPACFFVTTSK